MPWRNDFTYEEVIMEVLCVDYVQLMDRARNLYELLSITIDYMGELNDVVKDLDIFWEGEANDEFITAIGEDIAKASVLLDRLRQIIRLIVTAFDEYQETEKVISQMIKEVNVKHGW